MPVHAYRCPVRQRAAFVLRRAGESDAFLRPTDAPAPCPDPFSPTAFARTGRGFFANAYGDRRLESSRQYGSQAAHGAYTFAPVPACRSPKHSPVRFPAATAKEGA